MPAGQPIARPGTRWGYPDARPVHAAAARSAGLRSDADYTSSAVCVRALCDDSIGVGEISSAREDPTLIRSSDG
jgi:hypothetical protein